MRHRPVVVWVALAGLAVLGVVAACAGNGGNLGAGEPCSAASECGPGLACDFGQTPPVCAGNVTSPPDGAVDTPDAAEPVIDAAPGTPDAAPTPDANTTPDADTTPDANTTPDADTTPDAMPDAMV